MWWSSILGGNGIDAVMGSHLGKGALGLYIRGRESCTQGLPWVKVSHCASHLLARCAKRLSADWQALYHHPVHWVETFGNTERFPGTCYRALNWRFLGKATGRGKNDQTGKPNRSIKDVYGFPPSQGFQREAVPWIRGKPKPCMIRERSPR